MFWWIAGSLVVIGIMALIAVWQSRKTEKAIEDLMRPVYPEAVKNMPQEDLIVGEGMKSTTIILPHTTGSHNPVRHVHHPYVGGSQGGAVGMDVGLDPVDMIILGDAILNSSSDPGYQPDDSPVYVSPEPTHYSAPEPVESSHSWGESSSSSSWGDSSSSSFDCGGGGGDCGGGGCD